MQSIFLPTPSAASGLSTRAAPISVAGFGRRARRNANMGAVKSALQQEGDIPEHGVASKLCDSCKSATSSMFCKNDSAIFCIPCDSKDPRSQQGRLTPRTYLWMCEVCEQASAHVTCKADAAALCVSCDRIHSANPLARRHERFPVVPFYDSVVSGGSDSDAVELQHVCGRSLILLRRS